MPYLDAEELGDTEPTYSGKGRSIGKIVVSSITYSVRTVKDLYVGSMLCHGLINFKPNEILINADVPEEDQAEALLHETLHAISDQFHLGMGEELVTRLSSGLYDTIRRNPLLRNRLLNVKNT